MSYKKQFLEWTVPKADIPTGEPVGYEIELSPHPNFYPISYRFSSFDEIKAIKTGRLFYSLDNGVTWIDYPLGDGGQAFTTSHMLRLLVHASESSFILALRGNILYKITADAVDLTQTYTISQDVSTLNVNGKRDEAYLTGSNNALYKLNVFPEISPENFSLNLNNNPLDIIVDSERNSFWQIDNDKVCLKGEYGEQEFCIEYPFDIGDIDIDHSSSSSSSSIGYSSSSSSSSQSTSSSSSIDSSSSSSLRNSSSSSSVTSSNSSMSSSTSTSLTSSSSSSSSTSIKFSSSSSSSFNVPCDCDSWTRSDGSGYIFEEQGQIILASVDMGNSNNCEKIYGIATGRAEGNFFGDPGPVNNSVTLIYGVTLYKDEARTQVVGSGNGTVQSSVPVPIPFPAVVNIPLSSFPNSIIGNIRVAGDIATSVSGTTSITITEYFTLECNP